MSTEPSKPDVPSGPDPAVPENPGSGRPRQLMWAIVVALGVFLILESVDAFIAVPLREISSVLVEFFLGLVGFPISRAGTILSTPRVTFDIVPACSGSTTLRVLLFVTITWCWIHPRLSPGRRLLCVLLAVPLALMANAVRISAMVVLGHLVGEAPGEVFHVFSGICAFVLAMVASFVLTDLLAVSDAPLPRGRGRTASVLLSVLLVFLFAPFLFWCIEAWIRSPLDGFGFAFVLAAGGWAAFRWWRAPDDASWEVPGTIGFGLALLLLLAAVLVDVNIMKGVACLGVIITLALTYKGGRFAVSMIPVLGIVYLGFPTVSYQLQFLTLPLAGSAGMGASLALKVILAVLLAAATRIPVLRPATQAPSGAVSRFRLVGLVMTAILAAFQGYYYSVPGSGDSSAHFEMSFLQGDWVGRDHEISGGQDFLSGGRIWSRRYVRGQDSVDVLVTTTGGDRHRAHPPEYCLTGGGWTVTQSRADRIDSVPMTRLRLVREPRETFFCYWFTDGEASYPTYREMLVEDSLRRLTGRRTDWFLFRVMTEQGDSRLEEFLATFETRIKPPSLD